MAQRAFRQIMSGPLSYRGPRRIQRKPSEKPLASARTRRQTPPAQAGASQPDAAPANTNNPHAPTKASLASNAPAPVISSGNRDTPDPSRNIFQNNAGIAKSPERTSPPIPSYHIQEPPHPSKNNDSNKRWYPSSRIRSQPGEPDQATNPDPPTYHPAPPGTRHPASPGNAPH